MATCSIATRVIGRYIGEKPNPITDKETGEITQMTKFEFVTDVFITEVKQVFTYEKLPATDPTYTAYVMNSDEKQLNYFRKLQVGKVYEMNCVPLAKGGNRRGAGGVKFQFVGDAKQLA